MQSKYLKLQNTAWTVDKHVSEAPESMKENVMHCTHIIVYKMSSYFK